MGRVEDYPVEQWDVMIAVLLSAPFHLTKMAIPHMKRKGVYSAIQKVFAFFRFHEYPRVWLYFQRYAFCVTKMFAFLEIRVFA